MVKRMIDEVHYGKTWSIYAECTETALFNGNNSVAVRIRLVHGTEEMVLVDKTVEVYQFMSSKEIFDSAKSEVTSLLGELGKIGVNTRTRDTRYIEREEEGKHPHQERTLIEQFNWPPYEPYEYPVENEEFKKALERLEKGLGIYNETGPLDNKNSGLFNPNALGQKIIDDDIETTIHRDPSTRLKIGKGFEKLEEQLREHQKSKRMYREEEE